MTTLNRRDWSLDPHDWFRFVDPDERSRQSQPCECQAADETKTTTNTVEYEKDTQLLTSASSD